MTITSGASELESAAAPITDVARPTTSRSSCPSTRIPRLSATSWWFSTMTIRVGRGPVASVSRALPARPGSGRWDGLAIRRPPPGRPPLIRTPLKGQRGQTLPPDLGPLPGHYPPVLYTDPAAAPCSHEPDLP